MTKDEKRRAEQGARLRAAREAAGYKSARDAALSSGWKESSYRAHESGTRTVGQDDAEKYARRFKTTARAILFGDLEEPRRVSLTEEYAEDLSEAGEMHRAYSRESYRPRIPGAVPEIDVEIGAGEGRVGEVISLPIGDETYSGHQIVDEWLLPESYFDRVLEARSGNTLVMPVVGDSMMPTYSPGDRVLIDLTQDRLTTDTVYAISDGFSPPQIKRLQRVLLSHPTEVEVISDNPIHSRQVVPLKALRIIGRIVGVVAKR